MDKYILPSTLNKFKREGLQLHIQKGAIISGVYNIGSNVENLTCEGQLDQLSLLLDDASSLR